MFLRINQWKMKTDKTMNVHSKCSQNVYLYKWMDNQMDGVRAFLFIDENLKWCLWQSSISAEQ